MKRKSKPIEIEIPFSDEDIEHDTAIMEQMRQKFMGAWKEQDMDRHFATDNRDAFSQAAFLKDAMEVFGKLK